MSSSTNASSQTIDDLKALLHDAEQALSGAGDVADDKISELRNRMRTALEKGGNAYNRARECAQEKLTEADQYVRSHPYQSIGTGLAIGALLGLLIGRRLP
jgi:ElaB/YqjD/DUF883 family membrane-anchored ribosome-binding protein